VPSALAPPIFREVFATVKHFTFNNFFALFPLAELPDKPTNLTVNEITSRSAEISWLDPKNRGRYSLTNFWIELKKDNSLILSITTQKVNKYKINNLTPYTTYEISVATGNYQVGFDDGTITSFSTSEEGEF
jgi:hypothetical protein